MKRIGNGIHYFSTFQMSTTKKCNGNGIKGVLCPVSVITVENIYILLSLHGSLKSSNRWTWMRSKCRSLHKVHGKFLLYGLNISTLHSKYKKMNGQDFQAISKCWVKTENLMQCMHSLSLSVAYFLDNNSHQIIAMH